MLQDAPEEQHIELRRLLHDMLQSGLARDELRARVLELLPVVAQSPAEASSSEDPLERTLARMLAAALTRSAGAADEVFQKRCAVLSVLLGELCLSVLDDEH